ncbi:unnamed protein product [Ectocarpus sp. CCAP 1310/34]|nr:unnamed protein product [Ectocarpus sp. CCAP 1310/34]
MENNVHPQVGSKRPLSETISQPSQQALAVSSAPPPAASAAADSARGSSSVATTSSNGGAAVAGSDDPKPGRSKAAYGPDMRILEVTNNGEPANMEMLIHLKEIFHQQLPKMPKEYIVRLVFDRKHHSIVLTKKGVPIGGITYRPFVEQKFGEIAFCAVASNSQVQGYGSRLMNELKMVAIREDLSHFHTYADNYAIGYFAKHGFTKNLTMSRDRWFNYVKDYDGGTHMECYVHPTVPYMKQAEMFEIQSQFLRERIADISSSKVVHPGLSEEAFNSLEHHIDIPGVAEAGWTMDELNAQNRRKRDGDALAVNKELLAIWRELEKHDVAWVFREPVDLTEVTDYTSIIERPIDLSVIRENLDELDPKPYYANKEQLREDLDLMIRNCKKYNGQDTEFWAAADTMEKFIAEIYDRS